MLGALIGYLTASRRTRTSVYKVGQHSVRLLMAVGDLLIGWLLLRQAEVALAALDGAASARGRAVLRGQDRRGAVLRQAPCCPSSPPGERSSSAPTTR